MNDGFIFAHLNYWVFICLMMLGLWAMISKNNLIKKIMGMGIFQSSIILFYVSIATKDPGATIPIYPHDLIHPPHAQHDDMLEAGMDAEHVVVAEKTEAMYRGEDETAHEAPGEPHADEGHGHPSIAAQVNPDDYDNPLPHVLMLTAIVVGVATLGVALSLVQRLYRLYGSIEEDAILAAIEKDSSDGLRQKAGDTTPAKGAASHA